MDDRSHIASEILEAIKRSNPSIVIKYNRFNGYRNAGLYTESTLGQLVFHMGVSCGSIPKRTKLDSSQRLIVRGWLDTVSKLYVSGVIRKTPELVRLVGQLPFDYADRTGSSIPNYEILPEYANAL